MMQQPDDADPRDLMPASGSRPLEAAAAKVGDRWALLLVAALLPGPRRFNDLLAEVPGIAPNILIQRLRRLERDGLVVAEPYSTRPPRFTYRLTEAARELTGALRLLAGRGARHSTESPAPRHASCGTPLEVRWFCATCARVVEDSETRTGEESYGV
jgi:DNA-binding HxlR family transcriptional regulator